MPHTLVSGGTAAADMPQQLRCTAAVDQTWPLPCVILSRLWRSNRALTYLKMHKPKEALADALKAIELEPTFMKG